MADRFHISSPWQFTHISFKHTHTHAHTQTHTQDQTPYPPKNLTLHATSAKPQNATKTERKTQLYTSDKTNSCYINTVNHLVANTHIRITHFSVQVGTVRSHLWSSEFHAMIVRMIPLYNIILMIIQIRGQAYNKHFTHC